MPGDSKAFNEVRALLGKLDRSIDEARSKRVGPKEPVADRPIGGSENRPVGRSELDREVGAPRAAAVPATPMQAKRAQYGRAKPLGARDEDVPAAKPAAETGWKSPKNYDDLTIG